MKSPNLYIEINVTKSFTGRFVTSLPLDIQLERDRHFISQGYIGHTYDPSNYRQYFNLSILDTCTFYKLAERDANRCFVDLKNQLDQYRELDAEELLVL